MVWDDADNDGIRDPGEGALPFGTMVYLRDGSGSVLASATTDGGGNYSFTGLGSGTYEVEFYSTIGYAFSAKDQGSDDTADSDADTTTGRTGTFGLSAGQNVTHTDAALHWVGYGSGTGYGSGIGSGTGSGTFT